MTRQTPTTVAILGGNSVVGRALVQLLQGVGYEVRLLEEPEGFRPQELLEGVDVLILMPAGPGKAFREDFLIAVRSTLSAARIPVLALSLAEEKETPPLLLEEMTSLAPWPCRIEELASRIEAARRGAAQRKEEPGSAFGTAPPEEEDAGVVA